MHRSKIWKLLPTSALRTVGTKLSTWDERVPPKQTMESSCQDFGVRRWPWIERPGRWWKWGRRQMELQCSHATQYLHHEVRGGIQVNASLRRRRHQFDNISTRLLGIYDINFANLGSLIRRLTRRHQVPTSKYSSTYVPATPGR
jgi:hypothetical protein